MTTIEIQVNDQPQQVPSGTTIAGLLDHLGLSSPAIAVELNLKVKPRDEFPTCVLQEGDTLEIVTLVGGG